MSKEVIQLQDIVSLWDASKFPTIVSKARTQCGSIENDIFNKCIAPYLPREEDIYSKFVAAESALNICYVCMDTDRKNEQELLDQCDSDDDEELCYMSFNKSSQAKTMYTQFTMNKFASCLRNNYLFDVGFQYPKQGLCSCPCSIKYQGKIWRDQNGLKYMDEKDKCEFKDGGTSSSLIQHLHKKADQGCFLHAVTLEYLKHLHSHLPVVKSIYHHQRSTKKKKSTTYIYSKQYLFSRLQYKMDRTMSSRQSPQLNLNSVRKRTDEDHNTSSKKLKTTLSYTNIDNVIEDNVSNQDRSGSKKLKNTLCNTNIDNVCEDNVPKQDRSSFKKFKTTLCNTNLDNGSEENVPKQNCNTSKKLKTALCNTNIDNVSVDNVPKVIKVSNTEPYKQVQTSTKETSISNIDNVSRSLPSSSSATVEVNTSCIEKSISKPILTTTLNEDSSSPGKELSITNIDNVSDSLTSSSPSTTPITVHSPNIKAVVSRPTKTYTFTTVTTSNVRFESNIKIVYRSNRNKHQSKSEKQNKRKREVLQSKMLEKKYFFGNPHEMNGMKAQVLDVATGTTPSEHPTPRILYGIIRCVPDRHYPWRIRLSTTEADIHVSNRLLLDIYTSPQEDPFPLWVGRAFFTDLSCANNTNKKKM